ncbi:MAG: GNAT family N-acetyltransferase [Acidobacteriota bacterium]|nr:GNAT family N-acetyltransferase [Acidobacteriota bacterium]
MPLRLRPYRLSDERIVRRARDDLRADDFELLYRFEEFAGWADYLEHFRQARVGNGLREGEVPSMLLCAELDGNYVGQVSVRLATEEYVTPVGGHVGVGVLAPYRRQGLASEMLRQALIVLRAEGVRDAVVTCHDTNFASRAAIEASGARFDGVFSFTEGAPPDMRRYVVAPPTSSLWLRPLALDDEGSARAAHAEILPEDSHFLLQWSPEQAWPSYLARLRDEQLGRDLAPDRVRGTFVAAVVGDELVGRASIRFSLNEFLAAWGGHIGYAVIAAHRRRGYASEILRQALVVARAEGVERATMTCFDDNVGSSSVIERAGGVLESIGATHEWPERMRRYFIM